MINVMRMGTHAEKDYFLLGARAQWFDELLVNANLLEGTSAASSLIAFRVAQHSVGFFIDPITYAFGLDPQFMMSDTERRPRPFKRTFLKLASRYGIINEGEQTIPRLDETWFNDDARRETFCRNVLDFQQRSVQDALAANEEFIAGNIGEMKPARLLAPYFHISIDQQWREVNANLVVDSANIASETGDRVWALLCLDPLLLENPGALGDIGSLYGHLPCEGYALWLTPLNEQRATRSQIQGLIALLRSIRAERNDARILQMYGGYFSALLRPFGIEGVSHGIGYGEQRDVTPVVGGGLPPAKYYFPPIHDEISILDLVRIAQGMTVQQFTQRICRCVICEGFLRNGVDALLDAYSQTERRPYRGGFRDFPTPDVYRMTRFHFLQNRQIEMQRLTSLGDAEFPLEASALAEAYGQYVNQIYPAPTFLRTWRDALLSAYA